jgi:hypothetical protein
VSRALVDLDVGLGTGVDPLPGGAGSENAGHVRNANLPAFVQAVGYTG